jgi:hypothetical protein
MSGSIVTLPRIFIRKARNFAKDPIGTTKNQPHRIRAATSKWHLERNGVIDVVREFQEVLQEQRHQQARAV